MAVAQVQRVGRPARISKLLVDEPARVRLVEAEVLARLTRLLGQKLKLLVSRDYENAESNPEWGINLSRKNRPLLEQYGFDRQAEALWGDSEAKKLRL